MPTELVIGMEAISREARSDCEYTYFRRELLPFVRREVIQSNSLVHAGVVPLAILVVETFCIFHVRRTTWQKGYTKSTGGLVHPPNDIAHRPAMGSGDARVRAALEKWRQEVAVLFALGTPVCSRFL